jgi:RNA polymerase sigma factor (sigma-70 family)
MTTDDMELVRQYAAHQSESAFAALVSRHTNLVYSAALRRVCDPQLAQEVTQATFIILARKAGSLDDQTILPGWLYRTACFVSGNALKREYRRQQREQEAYMQSTLDEAGTDAAWKQMSPLLEEAMLRLGQTDRDAVVLRYFEGRSLNEVGTALGASEDAAKKRVNRAVEKLRGFFIKRGVVIPATVLSAAISANSVQAAPVVLAKSVTSVAIVKGSIATASTLTLVNETLKIMPYAKLKLAAGIGVAMLVASGVVTMIIAQPQINGTNSGVSLLADESMLIVPGQSVGKVKAGMTEDDVIVALGQPESKEGEVLIYDKSFGFSVVCSRQKIVGSIFCGGGVDFKGHTKEGIGIDSGQDELIKTFGQPTTWAKFPEEQLYYKPLGLTFLLQNGKVFHIIVDLRKP